MIEEHSLDMNTQVDNEFSVSSSENTKTVACNNKSNAPQTDSLLKLDVTNLEPKNGSDKKQDDTVCQMKLDSVKHNFEDSKSNLAETKQSEPVCSSCFANMAEESKSETDIEKSQPNSLQYRNNHDYEISDPDESDKNDIDQHVSSTHNIPPMIEIICLSRSESPTSGSNCQKHDKDSSSPWLTKNSDGAKENLSTAPIKSPEVVRTNATIRRLRLENEKLQAEVTRLRRLVVSGALSLLNEKRLATDAKIDSPDKLQALQIELQLTKEALITLKSDRKRLKAEKFDLLNQMKQLYITLEDKEKELRDFIRNYEQSMRENDTSLQQLSTEREERERERWSLLRHARDEAEQSLSLAAQLNAKELQLQHAQEQLQDARRQLASSGCLSDHESVASMSRQNLSGGAVTPNSGIFPASAHGIGLLPGDRGSCSADSGVRVSSDRESAATSIGDNLSDCTTDVAFTKDSSPTQSPSIASPFARTTGSNILSRSVEQLNSPLDEPVNLGHRSKNSRPTGGRGGTWGSISRVFARSRNRSKSNLVQGNSDGNLETFRNWSPLTEEGYAEKLRLLREASSVPMERWRAPTVVAWLEVALGMPQYGTRCSENIKSGKVLLELSDFELECGLGITHPMHRKKLRLAIEEHRHPELIRYSCIAQLGHTWVSSEWLLHLGLSQYTETFAANLVDARILEHLSKKELEKYLGVTRKFHQASIVHGIHLLRIMKYDRQALAVRRHQCENMDADPLVWTNQRFIRWARNIDLGEYADNLKDSGVHGGLVVLEPSFNSDTMGTALGIPSSKNIIRKHLTAELDALILPARYVIFCQMEEYQMEATHVMYHKTSKTKNNNY